MSYIYRVTDLSDDDLILTFNSGMYVAIDTATINAATITAFYPTTMTQSGGLAVLNNLNVTNVATIAFANVTNNSTVAYINTTFATNTTERVSTGPIYLGSGTVAIGWGAVDAAKTGVYISGTTNYGIGSLYTNTTYGTMWVKTNHASTAWATMYATPST